MIQAFKNNHRVSAHTDVCMHTRFQVSGMKPRISRQQSEEEPVKDATKPAEGLVSLIWGMAP